MAEMHLKLIDEEPPQYEDQQQPPPRTEQQTRVKYVMVTMQPPEVHKCLKVCEMILGIICGSLVQVGEIATVALVEIQNHQISASSNYLREENKEGHVYHYSRTSSVDTPLITPLILCQSLLGKTAFTYTIITILMLATRFVSQPVPKLPRRPCFEFYYHLFGAIFYALGSLFLIPFAIAQVIFAPIQIVAGIFGFFCCILHSMNAHYVRKDWDIRCNEYAYKPAPAII